MFDPKKIFDMVKNAGEMQKNLAEKLKMQTAEGEAAGGMVKVVMNGHFEVESIKIDDALFTEEKVFVEDVIKAAMNDAASKLRASLADHIKSLTGTFGF